LQKKLERALVNADSLFTGINTVLNQEGKDNMSTTLADLSKTIKSINGVAASLDQLLDSQEGNLTTTLDNFAKISSNVNQLTDSLAQSNIKQTLVAFENTVNRLNGILSDIEQGKGSMGKLMKDESVYNNIQATTKEIELLIKDLKEHPKRYVHFSLFGKKETPYEEKKNE